MKKIYVLVLLLASFYCVVNAQNVGISANGATPNASAMLDVDVSSLGATAKKGLLIPRVALLSNTDVATIPSPVTSLMVYNTTAASSGATAVFPGFYYWNGTKWVGFQEQNKIIPHSAFATRTLIDQLYTSGLPTWQDVGGLSITITTTGPATFVISAMGALQCYGSADGSNTTAFRVVENGVYVPNSFLTRDVINKNGSTSNTLSMWGIQTTKTVTAAGTYTYKVQAAWYQGNRDSYVGGNAYGTGGSTNQGSLLITQYNQ